MKLIHPGYYILFTIFSLSSLQAQQSAPKAPEFVQYENSKWVDSIMETLTPDERIAQLIMVAAFSNRGEEHREEILKAIKEQKVGGVLFFQGGPVRQAKLMNEYQAASKVPLLGAIDAEWGLGMRLDSTMNFPYQMALGAIQDEDLIYDMGAEIARQIKRTGLHLNFAPVLDVNNNANNPVINYRSFGEDKYNVTSKALAYMRGMQDRDLMTTAKHFPGHGDTDTDSHYALPQINHTRIRLDSLELYPFREVINEGIGGIMVAHLDIPSLDPTGVPSTLSKPIITQLLKEELNFQGLIVTDAMNMKGVTDGNTPGIVDKDAILAGNDLLEYTEDVPKAIEEIRNAIDQGLISQAEIDRRCRKILAVKYWVGLHDHEPVALDNLMEDLNTPEAHLLNRKLTEASITLLKNEGNLLPIRQLENIRIASVGINSEILSDFQKTLSLYAQVDHFNLKNDFSAEEIQVMLDLLQGYDIVIAGIHDTGARPHNVLEMTSDMQDFLKELSAKENAIISFFKNPYVLDKLENVENAAALFTTYQDSENSQELAAQLIFGGIGAGGKLPVSVGTKFKAGDGIDTEGGIRFKYTSPGEVGMDSNILNQRIDSLMQEAMQLKAIPGGQILVARGQKVVFHKAYGNHHYIDTVQVKLTDVYDLASVTKISATMAALMKLHDEGKFSEDATLGDYLPRFRRSNKKDIPLYDILTHQGRLEPWIPFWKDLRRKNGSYKWFTIKRDSSRRYPIKVAPDMYLHRNYPDKIVNIIRKSPLQEKKEYKYSDFFFILAPRIVENISEEKFEDFLQKNFYESLGAKSLLFNPMKKYLPGQIVPTEDDFLFRRETIHGTVHDEGAIMLGGISGHAGLFGNANDLAKLLQMYLNMGEYGGRRYLNEETLQKFTTTQFPENDNHRALGFDKPFLEYRGEKHNTARDASKASFGHTGFTGIMVWMDPEVDLLYIFLSNRVTPTRENTRLYELSTRTKIQQVLYDAMK